MKLRTTLGAGVTTAVTAATLCALGAPALATPPAAPWDQPLTGSPIDVALTADGGSAVVLVDGGTDDSGNGRPDIVQWRDADTGSVSRSVTLPSAYAAGIAVATDGTVAVAGEDGDSADSAVVWTIAPGDTTATTTDLSAGGSYAAAVAVTGDVATVGGVDNGASVLWSLALDDLADVTSTTLAPADDTTSQSLTSVVDADDATYATVTATSYDDGTNSSQLWRVDGGTPESVWSSDGAAVRGVAVADGLVQIAVANPANEEAASLITLDPAAQTTTSRGLGLRYPSSIAAFGDQVLVTTEDGAALVPATGTASYTPDDTPPLVQFDTGSAQKVLVGATAAIGITPWDATSAEGDPSVFQVTAPATPPRRRWCTAPAPPSRGRGATARRKRPHPATEARRSRPTPSRRPTPRPARSCLLSPPRGATPSTAPASA